MKSIQPISVWKSGTYVNAVAFDCYVIKDNLQNSALLYYNILSNEGLSIDSGNLSMEGADYDGYSTNEYVWSWVANKIGVVITGEFTPPPSPTLVPESAPNTPPTQNENVIVEDPNAI